VEKSQYKLCLEVLKRFNRCGLSSDFILIGSWAVVFYEEYFKKKPEFVLRTRDLDFLIDNPGAIKTQVDIPDLLKDLGFVISFSNKGYMSLSHSDLILEFLVPEKGKEIDRPVSLRSLGMNATALRFLSFLSENVIEIKTEDFIVTLPHPVHFTLHKFIVSQRSDRKPDKAIKDREAAIAVFKALMAHGEERSLGETFKKMIPGWQKMVLKGISLSEEPKLAEILKKS